jgi:hypothetical protein
MLPWPLRSKNGFGVLLARGKPHIASVIDANLYLWEIPVGPFYLILQNQDQLWLVWFFGSKGVSPVRPAALRFMVLRFVFRGGEQGVALRPSSLWQKCPE